MVPKRVLLIEDDQDHRKLVKFILEMNTDWKILLASKGIEGITQAELEQPDVILLDVMMPEVNGFDVCKILKSNKSTCSIPIIFITAMSQRRVVSHLDTTLAKGIITKPFDSLNLHSQIVKICNWNLIEKISMFDKCGMS